MFILSYLGSDSKDESKPGFSLKPWNTSNQRNNQKIDKPKSGRALWQGLAAVIRFKVFAKNTSVGDHAAG